MLEVDERQDGEDTKLQAGELIQVGEYEGGQVYPLHLTGSAIQQGGTRRLNLMGRRQGDARQRDLERSTGMGDATTCQRVADKQQGNIETFLEELRGGSAYQYPSEEGGSSDGAA